VARRLVLFRPCLGEETSSADLTLAGESLAATLAVESVQVPLGLSPEHYTIINQKFYIKEQ
jgi:hypothetical protein